MAHLWECLSQSETHSRVISQTEIKSVGGRSDVKVTLKNGDGQLADFFFSVELGRATLYRIAMSKAATRKRILIEALLEDMCKFSK